MGNFLEANIVSILNELREPIPKSLHFSGAGAPWISSFSLHDFDRVITTIGIKHGQFSILSETSGLKPIKVLDSVDQFTRVAVPGKLLQRTLVNKQTLLIRHLQHYHPFVAATYNSLENNGFRLRDVVAIFSPPDARATVPHADAHTILQLQLHGSKDWMIWSAPSDLEFDAASTTSELAEKIQEYILREPAQKIQMKPGDVLLVPRRRIHTATTSDETSLSLSFQMQDGFFGIPEGTATQKKIYDIFPQK